MDKPYRIQTLQNARFMDQIDLSQISMPKARSKFQEKKLDEHMERALKEVQRIVGFYTFGEYEIINAIEEAEFIVNNAIENLFGRAVIERNRGTQKLPMEPNSSDVKFVRSDLADLPSQAEHWYQSSVETKLGSIRPLGDTSAYVSEYLDFVTKRYKIDFGIDIQSKSVKEKKKDKKEKKKDKDADGKKKEKKEKKEKDKAQEPEVAKVEEMEIDVEEVLATEEEIQTIFKDSFQNVVPMLVVVVCGTHRSGKSTLVGHLLEQSGGLKAQQWHRCKFDAEEASKPKSKYAWVMDQRQDERENLMTIQTGQWNFDSTKRYFTLLDTPGHPDFSPSMIEAMSRADAAIIVINAIKSKKLGYYDFSHVEEHGTLLRSFGIKQLVVAVNKLDAFPQASMVFEQVVDICTDYLITSGYRKSQLTFVPISAFEGENLTKNSKNFQWHTGSTLLDALNQFEPTSRDFRQPFRMTINDVVVDSQLGAFISGRVDSGFAKTGETLALQPLGRKLKIKSLKINDDYIEQTFAGDFLTIEVSKESKALFDVLRCGQLLTASSTTAQLARKFKAQVILLPAATPLIHGSTVTLHSNHLNVPAIVEYIESKYDENLEVYAHHSRHITGGCSGLLRFSVEHPVWLERYQRRPQYGRFILRSGTNILGTATVTEILG